MMLMRNVSDFLYKSVCYWYSFELLRLVEAIQLSTNNICCYKEGNKRTRAAV